MKKLVILTVMSALFLFSSKAWAADKYFQGESTDSSYYWSDSAHWTDSTLPVAGDNVYIAGYEDWELCLNQATPLLGTVTVDNKSLVFADDSLLSAAGINVGLDGSGYFEQLGQNSVTDTTDMILGVNPGSFGHGHLLYDSGMIKAVNLYVGNYGEGEFMQEGGHNYLGYNPSTGTYNNESAQLSLGRKAGSTGKYYLSNGDLYAYNIQIGHNGFGEFNQTGGTVYVENPEFRIGCYAGSSGKYNLSSGTLNVKQVHVGNYGVGEFNQTGGDVYVGYTGVLWNRSKLSVGRYAGSSGTYNLSGGGIIVLYEDIGSNGSSGVFNQSGGLHQIGGDLTIGGGGVYNLTSGTLYSRYAHIGGDSNGVGVFSQSGGSHTCELTLNISGAYTLSGNGVLNASTEEIGNTSNYPENTRGIFNQTGGVNSASLISVGVNSGKTLGVYNLSGDGEINAQSEYVGYYGPGIFNQANGINNITSSLYLGVRPEGPGQYTLSGGVLNAKGNIYVGMNAGTCGFDYSGGSITAANLINRGTFTVRDGGTEANPLTIDSNIENNAEFRVANAAADFKDNFVNNSAFYSNASQATFNDLTVNPNGFIQAGVDKYAVEGDFINKSTQTSLWNTVNAQLVFTEGTHNVVFNSLDLGAAEDGYVNNFAWGDVSFNNGTFVFGQLDNGDWGALYTGTLSGLLLEGDTVTNIAGGSNIYYLAQPNAWLAGKTYNFSGGGQLRPVGVVPESISSALFLVGAGVLGLAAKKRRPAA